MKIPVFVSAPTTLNAGQERARKLILNELEKLNLEPRTLGKSDYPTLLPLREVCTLAKHCSGGVILGFEHFRAAKGVWKPDHESKEEAIKKPVSIPTPWNHLEAGILFSLKLPLLVFRESGITGGVFDPGVTDVFLHQMPDPSMSKRKHSDLSAVFLKWQAEVRLHYYQ